jgi:hydrogenase-4 component E
MRIEMLTPLEQTIFLIAGLVLFTSFILLAQPRLVAAVRVFAWQGALIGLVTALVAVNIGSAHLFISALLTVALKALLIPWMLHRLIRRLALDRFVETLQRPALVLMGAAMLVIFSYWLVTPVVQLEMASTRNIVAISLSIVLIGMLLMASRQQAVAQVLGFMSIENGLFLVAVSATHGMPLIVELGIAFDVLVAMILFGVFFFQIRSSIDSLDVDRMNRLTESRDDQL